MKFLKNNYSLIFAGLSVLRALMFWIFWWIYRAEIPWSVALMYRERGQDIEYFPVMAGVSTSGLREAFDFATKETRIISFPVGSVAFHSLCFRFFHVAGFVFADCVVAVLVYYLFSKVLQVFKVTPFWSNIFSVILVVGGFHKFYSLSKALWGHFGNQIYFLETALVLALVPATYFLVQGVVKKRNLRPVFLIFFLTLATLVFVLMYVDWEFFGWRFPRPFVSEIFFLGFMISLTTALRGNKSHSWMIVGAMVSLVIQSDIYRAVFCMILVFFCWLFLVVNEPRRRRELFVGAFLGLVSLTIFSIPFVLQRYYENPDLARRYGTYPIDRLHPYFRSPDPAEVGFFVALLCAFFVIFIFRKTFEEKESNSDRRAAIFLGAVYLLSWLSLPAFIVVTGKTIEAGHFLDMWYAMGTLLMITAFAHLIQSSERLHLLKINRPFVLVTVIMFSLASIARDTQTTFELKSHSRSDFTDYAGLPNYLETFSELVKELSKPEYQKSWSLATFDLQVIVWWQTFKDGLSFTPDPFSSVLSDDEIETRVLRVGKILRMEGAEFVDFLSRPTTIMFFLSTIKYHLRKGHTIAPIEDYEPEDQKLIQKTSFYNLANLAIPIPEKARLRRKFQQVGDQPIPDIIVLNKNRFFHDKEPRPDLYRASFSNRNFNVWVRK